MIDGRTQGPINYRDMYGVGNPWVRWLAANAPQMLRWNVRAWWEPDLFAWPGQRVRAWDSIRELEVAAQKGRRAST